MLSKLLGKKKKKKQVGKERLGGLSSPGSSPEAKPSTGSSYSLVNDQVWSKAQQVAIGLLVGPPAQSKSHQEHPGVLQKGHLVIQVQISETWRNKNWGGDGVSSKKTTKDKNIAWLGKGAGLWAAQVLCYQCIGTTRSKRHVMFKNHSTYVCGYLELMVTQIHHKRQQL